VLGHDRVAEALLNPGHKLRINRSAMFCVITIHARGLHDLPRSCWLARVRVISANVRASDTAIILFAWATSMGSLPSLR
jgi:hypothetical protein